MRKQTGPPVASNITDIELLVCVAGSTGLNSTTVSGILIQPGTRCENQQRPVEH
jgi:hypothetical protein